MSNKGHKKMPRWKKKYLLEILSGFNQTLSLYFPVSSEFNKSKSFFYLSWQNFQFKISTKIQLDFFKVEEYNSFFEKRNSK